VRRHTPITDDTILAVLVGAALLVPTALVARYLRRLPRVYVTPFLFALCCVMLGLAALALDLDVIETNRAVVFEEMFEMNGGLALLFAGLALAWPRRALVPRLEALDDAGSEHMAGGVPMPGLENPIT
jgi:hypothetical protein